MLQEVKIFMYPNQLTFLTSKLESVLALIRENSLLHRQT